jgi:hypothetical protein
MHAYFFIIVGAVIPHGCQGVLECLPVGRGVIFVQRFIRIAVCASTLKKQIRFCN